MSSFSTAMSVGGGDSKPKFCCALKEYYSKESNLVSTLDITPRIIFLKKSLKLNHVYSKTIQVKNKGIYTRSLKYRTDSDDTQIKVHGLPKVTYLAPNIAIYVEVIIRPDSAKRLNRRRNLYIDGEHPNITFEIPIIVLPKTTGPCYSENIEFPRSLPKSKIFYESIIYNATAEEANFMIRSYSTYLSIDSNCTKIKPNDFARIFLKLKVKDSFEFQGSCKIRFGLCVLPLFFIHKPKTVSLYISTPALCFEETKFDRFTIKSFTICNDDESQAIPFHFEFEENFSHVTVNLAEDNKNTTTEAALQEYNSESSITSAITLNEDKSLTNIEKTSQRVILHAHRNDYKHFRIEPNHGEFQPGSCTRVTITFNPRLSLADYDLEMAPPFSVEAVIQLVSAKDNEYKDSLLASGFIDGPDVHISPKAIDFRQVYLGEEHCEQIRVTNVDGIVDCQIDFHSSTGSAMAKVLMAPKRALYLQPCQQDIFSFTFYTIIVGKIYFKLKFKIKNGRFLTVVVRADSQPVRVKSFPELVEFGSVPFGVPQKRQVLLMNPLSVPISLQCFVKDNGTETPLVLNVDNVNELPPIDIKNPISNLIASQNEATTTAYSLDDLAYSCASDVISYNSVFTETDNLSVCSSRFQNEVIEPIEGMALNVVNAIKNKRIPEKNEPEAKILCEVAYSLLELPYFSELMRYNNYACMDWDATPSDPRELYFDTEIIHLKPNSGRSLTVLIVPNTAGYFNRAIDIRCCPHIQHSENEAYDHAMQSEMLCDSSLLITKLYVEYNCRVPHIKWENEISFPQGKVYAMQNYDFEINFENQSNIGGFLHFVLVPKCEAGVMRFRNNIWKFFIPAEDTATAYCTVEFKKIGDVILTGLVKIVGLTIGIPFHLTARVLPTKVSVSPTSIYKRQHVLETTYETIFITNLTPTVTGFILSLHDDSHQSIDTYGGQLGPNGQSTFVTIRTMYPDPEIYKNILYVDLLYGKKIEIPLTYNVVGMPIFFEPNLRTDFDAGTIILSSPKEYETRDTNYSQIVRIWNEGERPYSVSFQKIKGITDKNTGCSCCSEAVRAQFFINPRTVVLFPGGVAYVEISAVGCQIAMIYSEFRVTIVDQTNTTRFANLRFVLKGKFAQPELVWSPKKIEMTYNKTHKFLDHPQMEIVELVNNCNAPVKSVKLEVCGPFKIRELYEQQFVKKLVLNFKPLERKEITILLNKKQLENNSLKKYSTIKTHVFIHVDNSTHKSLPITLKTNYPDIVIVESEVVLFSSFKEDYTEIVIENIGLLEASYKWKKLGEYEKFVASIDDPLKFAEDLLNDILRMLELHEQYNFGEDPICHENLTFCYQKYRCILDEIPTYDPIGVTDIIDDIIANLDLEHKRYKIDLEEFEDDILSQTENDSVHSADKNVKKTLDTLVDNLKLEDSFTISDPTDEECDKKEHFYFCNKDGIVLPKHGAKCLLHLPPVRQGYAITAEFELDVVGGSPQSLNITVVNLVKIVELIPTSCFLGVKPWYEFCTASVAISNMTSYRINVEILQQKENNHDNFNLLNAYADVTSPRLFFMKAYCINRLKTEGIMGFSDEFIRDIKIRVCDRHVTSFRLRGQGIMPILLATGNKIYPRIDQTKNQIIDEYKILQKIYYFSMFKDITFVDEELEGPCWGEEEATMQAKEIELTFSEIFDLSDIEGDPEDIETSRMIRNKKNWELLLNTYVFAYNDSSLPNATILEQLINMVKFKNNLTISSAKRDILNCVYRDHIKMLCTYDEKMPINLKYFMVQPLPHQQLGYIIEMNDLKLNQFRRYQIELQFLGPGKLIASARTAVKIPGLYVHFEVYEKNSCDKFELYRAEEKMPDFYVKKYRNMWERQIDAEIDPRLHHAHSFDCEERCKCHIREIVPATAKNRRDINNYYNSLNKSCYVENKHHFINCTIFAKCKQNFSGTKLRVHLLIKPDEKYFAEGQVLEDFLYIDLHMGPTLPILMRGLVK